MTIGKVSLEYYNIYFYTHNSQKYSNSYSYSLILSKYVNLTSLLIIDSSQEEQKK